MDPNEKEPSNERNLPATRDEFIAAVESLNPGSVLPTSLTPAQREKALEHLSPSKIKTGFLASIPMICRAEACPIAAQCPLQQQNIAPKGARCPFESAL